MREWQSQSHVRWYCRYHVVWVPKYRRRSIFGQLRREFGTILRELCRRRKVDLLEGHALPDHVHLLMSIPPKFSVANAVGFLKGKSAIRIHHQPAAEAIELAVLRGQTSNDLAQTAPSGELARGQGDELAPAGHATQLAAFVVLPNQGLEFISRDKTEKLGEDGRMLGQGLDPPLFAWVS